jgi:hypothetical protein
VHRSVRKVYIRNAKHGIMQWSRIPLPSSHPLSIEHGSQAVSHTCCSCPRYALVNSRWRMHRYLRGEMRYGTSYAGTEGKICQQKSLRRLGMGRLGMVRTT